MGCKAVLEHLTFFVSMGDSFNKNNAAKSPEA